MKEPANTSDPSPPPAGTGESGPSSAERLRFFTPIDSDPARRPKGLGRLTVHAALTTDDLESGPAFDTPAASTGSEGGKRPRPHRPALVPNTAIPFLEQVHARANPEQLERRVSSAARTAAFGALASVIVFVVGSSILFSTRPAARPDPAAASAPPARPELDEAGAAAAVTSALASLDHFLDSTTAAARREAVGTAEPLPPMLATDGRIDTLAGATVDRAAAQVLHSGSFKVVLAPVTDADGLPRTAAILHRGDRWRVDWRSLITPESLDWKEFLAGTEERPRLFRVLLSRDAAGAWTIARPAAEETAPLLASMAPGSRVAADLSAAMAARGQTPLAVDVYLETAAGRQLNIVDWTKDKWSL
jgi:hypothetical protein